MEQIRRIAQMEAYLDEITAAQAELSAALEKYEALREPLEALTAYYEGPLWMRDFTGDEAGKLPRELKRGVLSEDAVYDALTEHGRLRQEMLALCAENDTKKKTKETTACAREKEERRAQMKQRNTIAVIGAGTMGVGIAVQYAMCGHQVALYSRSEATLERARKVIEKNCRLIEQEGLATPEAVQALPGLVHTTTSLEEAVSDAWYVVETIVEDAEQKREMYARLDALLPEDIVISSNTSYLDPFSLMPERRQLWAAIVHWFAPAFIMPLVEIVKGPVTLPSVVERMKALHDGCGKTTVCMERFVPGFLVNRMQIAMKREVMFLLDNGYCTAEDIDLAVKSSLMPRGMLLGLVQRMDFGGLNMSDASYKTCPGAPDPGEDNAQARLFKAGRQGVKSGGGFYDYTHASYEEILHHRDVQLIRSVRLAQEFMADPLHDTKK